MQWKGIGEASSLFERNRHQIPYDVGIFFDREGKGVLFLNTNGERPLAPMLIVDQDNQELVLDNLIAEGALNPETMNFSELLRVGAAEYLDPLEMEYSIAVFNKDALQKRKQEIKLMETDLQNLIDEKEAFSEGTEEFKSLNKKIQILTFKLNNARSNKYTHCNVDPTSILGVSASIDSLFGTQSSTKRCVGLCSK